MRDFGGVKNRQRTAVTPVEEDADRLHRRQFPGGKIAGKAREHFARHIAAAIDGTANNILRALAAEESVEHLDLRPPMRRFHRCDQDRKCQDARNIRVAYEMHGALRYPRNPISRHAVTCAKYSDLSRRLKYAAVACRKTAWRPAEAFCRNSYISLENARGGLPTMLSIAHSLRPCIPA